MKSSGKRSDDEFMTKFAVKVLIKELLGLNNSEQVVFDALCTQQMARTETAISEIAKTPRSTTIYILKKFETRRLVKKTRHDSRNHWRITEKLYFLKDNLHQS